MQQQFDTPVILSDSKVRLRPLQAQDVDAFIRIAKDCPHTWRYSLANPAQSEQAMRDYIQTALSAKEQGVAYPFTVELYDTGEVIGSTRFYEIDPSRQSLAIGYTWLHEKERGTGINKRMKWLMLDYAFRQLQLARVAFYADARNEVSLNAMKSIGCILEGVLRENVQAPDGTRRNSAVLSILAHEWEDKLRTQLLAKIKGNQ
ncbi:GNAT family N-acetyltransferase [Spirabiliibacterium falconis]|uniref:GNAT family N-acetyltransferase n=1 Tax=Spirabiliibacterium falconis TaxID=572023 RepID=UPI001AAD190F|nr:GNAT family N-acetyltransferase [Spirabiliibacterium falconis]MBE2895129.1 GNAT family N-acetyltransferase [Spirabiliibacterium falconis]